VVNGLQQTINVIVVDTEGLGALDEDTNHDNKIFSLALLLSSTFVYNSMGAIDESCIENLSLIVNLTKHIQFKSRGEEFDEAFVKDNFPCFFWVLRDFSLKLQDKNGSEISPDEYLEMSLKEQEGYSEEVMNKNTIRTLLKEYFS